MKGWYKGVFAQKEDRKPTVIVDFDDTVARDAYPDIGEPCPGAREALSRLVDAGYDVVLYTCRMARNDGRPPGEADKHKRMIAEWMEGNGIPYTRIEDGLEGKPRADAYIDNKAIHYGGGEADWDSIAAYVLSKGRLS
jgi:hypothetical protein